MFIFGSYEYFEPIETISAFDNKSFIEAIKKVEELKEKYYLGGYISYRAKDIFLNKDIESDRPLLYFQAFKKRVPYKAPKAKKCKLYVKENIRYTQYCDAIDRIKREIYKGATYEVNYTFSDDVLSSNTGYELFSYLLKNQKTKYFAYIKNEFDEILSYSPELFFEIENNKITTKPMKGTVKRRGDDEKEIEFLKNDPKNLAENTMIVDLIRNDLSKIKGAYDIKVEKLFEVETLKTLHQMTSTISAKLKTYDLLDILSCLFPCGSITGAPKISTMKIIDEVENYKRNIYCGAIGVISKEKTTLSVPIRILEKPVNDSKFKFCQGGAIVVKSNIRQEYEECRTKRKFLCQNMEFNLVETFLESDREEHIKRLYNSAKELGFIFNEELWFAGGKKDKIIRVIMSKVGNYAIYNNTLTPNATNKIVISDKKVYSKNSFLYHKTDFCPWYLESRKRIQKKEIFDTIFFNEKDELTEGSRSNIVLKLKGKMYTPPISCGLLGGIARKRLLEKGEIKEKILYYDDLIKAQNIYLINSIRGMVEVEL